jgi:S1-C subfamily serine protease
MFSSSIKDKEIEVRYVEIATNILNENPNDTNSELRSWATKVIEHYSPVPFSKEARKTLLDKELYSKSNISGTPNNKHQIERKITVGWHGIKMKPYYGDAKYKRRSKDQLIETIKNKFRYKVINVEAGSPGNKAGIKKGDIINTVNDNKYSYYALKKLVADSKSDTIFVYNITRYGGSIDIPVKSIDKTIKVKLANY